MVKKTKGAVNEAESDSLSNQWTPHRELLFAEVSKWSTFWRWVLSGYGFIVQIKHAVTCCQSAAYAIAKKPDSCDIGLENR